MYFVISPYYLRRRQSQQGFNLIEAAIVLGVIGLVIGGIWVGAADRG
jgi:type II secretory pathway pseudopilin PulG